MRPAISSSSWRMRAGGSRAGSWVLGAGELTPARVDEFLEARRAEGYTLWLSPKAMAPVLAYLRGLDVVPTPSPGGPATPAEELVEHYRTYLVHERGLAAGTVAGYLHVARLFLATRSAEGALDLERLNAAAR